VSEEYSDPAGESEIRRRAAWLLAMLALVAVLVVTLMVLFLKGHSGPSAAPTGPNSYPTGPPATQHSSSRPGPRRHHPSRPGQSSVSIPPPVRNGHVNCPSEAPCVAKGDIGNAVAAINQYRLQHGQPAVSGSVSAAAQNCALTNGSDCTGSWAESQVATADGHEAVKMILQFAELLDPNLTSMQVGWAYDPQARQYYFAIIRND
jgi:hypothetical protein